MASTPQYKVDSAKVARFSFKRELCNYLYYSESLGKCAGYIYKTDSETVNKINNVLSGSESATIKKKDKLYVLPGNTLPLKRIKTYARSVGAYITTDIEKATLIVGNNNLNYDADYDDSQVKLRYLMFSVDNYSYVQNNTDRYVTTLSETFKDIVASDKRQAVYDSFINDKVPCIVSQKLIETMGYDTNVERRNDTEYFICPQALEVLYQVLAKKVSVITQEYLNANAHSNLDLSDPDVYKNLDNMLNSSDSDNNALGAELLFHAKITDDIMCTFHIWQLAKDHYYYINNTRDKNKLHFTELTDFYSLHGMGSENFILNYKDTISPDVFKRIMSSIIDDVAHYPGGSIFYELTHTSIGGIVYRLKDEWKRYLEPEKIKEDEYT